MNGPETPYYTLRGARPRPWPQPARHSTTGRATLILATVMLGWLVVMMGLAFVGGTGQTIEPAPVTVNRGVTVTPADGWTSGTDVWDVGPGGVSFKRAGAVAVFVADAYAGSAQELLQEQAEQFRSQFESFRSLPAVDTTVAGGLHAVELLFSGVTANGEVEGELVAAVSGQNTGVLVAALAPVGQLRRVQDDIDQMLGSLVIP